MRQSGLPLLVSAFTMAVAGLPGLADAEPWAGTAEPCQGTSLECQLEDALDPGSLYTLPMAGNQGADLLCPWLDRATCNALRQIASLLPLPEDPLPARPEGAAVDAYAEVSLRAKVGAAAVERTESVGANVSTHGYGDAHRGDQVPCVDPRGCPDLRVDDSMLAVGILATEVYDAASCAVQEQATSAGQRRLLRFTFTTPNVGDGDLYIGDPAAHPDWFEWGLCHGHHHFRHYAEYRLWRPEAYAAWLRLRLDEPGPTPAEMLARHPELASGFVAGHKQGFCAMDSRPYIAIYRSTYDDCLANQGISRGWADEYGYQLDGQWIDVTDVPRGLYVLEAEVNPARFYRELDYANNAAARLVLVPDAP